MRDHSPRRRTTIPNQRHDTAPANGQVTTRMMTPAEWARKDLFQPQGGSIVTVGRRKEKGLTGRQAAALDFIRTYIKEHNRPPMVKEIAEGIGIVAKSGAHKHLEALREKGLIDWDYKEIRSIRLLEDDEK